VIRVDDDRSALEDRRQVFWKNGRREVAKCVSQRLELAFLLRARVREVHLLDSAAGIQLQHHAELRERRDDQPRDSIQHRVVVAGLEERARVVQEPQAALD